MPHTCGEESAQEKKTDSEKSQTKKTNNVRKSFRASFKKLNIGRQSRVSRSATASSAGINSTAIGTFATIGTFITSTMIDILDCYWFDNFFLS